MVYYGDWKTNINIRQSLSMSEPSQRPLKLIIHDPQRSLDAPNALERPWQPHDITTGLLPIHTTEPAQPVVNSSPITTTSGPSTPATTPSSVKELMDLLAHKCVAASLTQEPTSMKGVTFPHVKFSWASAAISESGSMNKDLSRWVTYASVISQPPTCKNYH